MASEQFSLCWDNFHKNMSSGLNALLETEELVDVTLAVEGKYLKAHKMVLSVCSPYFKELFKANPCQHPIVFMKDVSYVAISDLLQFMYQGEVQVSQDNLTTFIKTAEALQIKGLTGDGNGSADTETDSTQDVKSTSSGGRQHADTDYKPTSRPKKQPVPSPISVPPPMLSKAPKRPRLSVSSNDSQSNPPAAAAASITKTEPISLLPETNAAPVQQFKVEPYDQNQSVTIPDDGDDHFGDETLDDTTVDDTEDYSMMEGEETEPQAGTSADGTGEGQEQKIIYIENPKPGKHPKLIVDNNLFLRHRTQATKTGVTIRWRCFNVFKTKCKAVLYTTLQEGTAIKVLYNHNHDTNIDKWDKLKMIAKKFFINRPAQACKRGPVKLTENSTGKRKVTRRKLKIEPEQRQMHPDIGTDREMTFHVAGQEQPIFIKLLDDPAVDK